jgi:hypothetical protein
MTIEEIKRLRETEDKVESRRQSGILTLPEVNTKTPEIGADAYLVM